MLVQVRNVVKSAAARDRNSPGAGSVWTWMNRVCWSLAIWMICHLVWNVATPSMLSSRK